jgi:4-amino-4-deoxy-L-arabinose transferase-like glycosyltransferase
MDNQAHKAGRFAGPFILLLVGGFMLKLSWFKWPDLLVDYGRELYVPWQINQGKVLYADIHHLYGPLSHYFNAFLFQIFGTGLSTLAYFNIFLVILLASFIYYLLRSDFGDMVSTVAVSCFLIVFAFSQYTGIANYNFVCPYSHEVTYGIFLFFAALLTFKKYLAGQKIFHAAVIGLLAGLLFLTKVEIFLAGFSAILFGLFLMFQKLKPVHPARHILVLILFFLLPVFAFFIYFSLHMPVSAAFQAIIGSYKNIFVGALAGNIFYQNISGIDDPVQNFLLIARYTAGYLLLFVFAGFIAYWVSRAIQKKRLYGAIVFTFAALLLFTFFASYPINWLEIAKPYPVFIFLLLAFLAYRLIKEGDDKTVAEPQLPFFVLAIFSLLLLFKMLLNVRFYHYGFALAMPAALVMICLMLHHFPRLISRWGNKNAAAGLMGVFIFFSLFFCFHYTKSVYQIKNYAVAGGSDNFFTFDAGVLEHGAIVNKTLEQINAFIPENETFIVLPEGVMLNYLSRRNNPSRYFEFTPNFVEAIGEEQILNDISGNTPSFVILVDKDTSEHGARYFGKDYALNISTWIAGNYDKVQQIGQEPLAGMGFGVIIARKKQGTDLGIIP